MEENCVAKIHQAKSALYGKWNAGVLVNQEEIKLETMDTWINLEVISNILSIPRLEKYYYCITYDTKEEWVIYTPEG